MEETPLKTQIGGSHYKEFLYQPIVLIKNLDLNHFQACILKYVLRHKFKNGKEDLQKAAHYVQLARTLKPINHCVLYGESRRQIIIFLERNDLTDIFFLDFMTALCLQDWDKVESTIKKLEDAYSEK